MARLKRFSASVDLDALILAVRTIAAQHPDRIYKKVVVSKFTTTCQYKPSMQADGTMSGCIIGEALRMIGVSTDGLDPGTIDSHFRRVQLPDTQKTHWIALVQQSQDASHTWSRAVQSADKYAPLFALRRWAMRMCSASEELRGRMAREVMHKAQALRRWAKATKKVVHVRAVPVD